MYNHFRSSLALVLALGWFACPPPCTAQEEAVGRIERMAEILGANREREIRRPTERVQIRRRGSDSWVNVAPRTPVALEEMLRVERFVDAQLEVDRSAQGGVLTFLPELLSRGGGTVFPPQVVGEQLLEGLYAVASEPDRAEELTVAIERGALVVDWVHGRLVVLAAGTRTVVTGTRLALSVNPEGDQGLLFLETGSISFPDFPQMQVSPGEFVHLQRGLPPSLWPHGALAPQQVEQAIRFHNQQIWRSTPFYLRPAFLVSMAAFAGAVVWATSAEGSGDTPTRQGTVVIRLPF